MVAEIRSACARVAATADAVAIDERAIESYAQSLRGVPPDLDPAPAGLDDPDELAAFWLTLDAINFGSGWFPTLRKHAGRSGYDTISAGVCARFRSSGAWTARELAQIEAGELARVTGQDPEHQLMALFAASLRDLGEHLLEEFDGSFRATVQSAGSSAVALVTMLATVAVLQRQLGLRGVRGAVPEASAARRGRSHACGRRAVLRSRGH